MSAPRAADVDTRETAEFAVRSILIGHWPLVADDVQRVASAIVTELTEGPCSWALRALGAARAEVDKEGSGQPNPLPGQKAPDTSAALSAEDREELDSALLEYYNDTASYEKRDVVVHVVERLVAEAEGRGLARHVAYLDRMERVLGPVRLRRSTGEPSESDFGAVARLVAEAPNRNSLARAIREVWGGHPAQKAWDSPVSMFHLNLSDAVLTALARKEQDDR